jgi:hypothetical protein
MSLERIQDDPYDMINSDDPEQVEGGLIMLRALAITGDPKADNVLRLLEAAECPDDPTEAARWVIQNRIDVANEEAREKESGCAGLLVLTTGLTAGALLLIF